MVTKLYEQRNAYLNRATSYSGIDELDTKRERIRCFIEADKITQEMERVWASNSKTPPINYNLYDVDGNITHMLQESDGITSRYVKLANWVGKDVNILELDPLERLRRHEIKANQDELEFKARINALALILNV